MKYILACVVIGLLAIQLFSVGAIEVTSTYDWYFEPREDGSLLIVMTVTIDKSYSSWAFTTSKSTKMKSIKAWELETGNAIDIEESDEGDRTEYLLEFQGTKGKGFQFVIEQERLDEVEKKTDNAFYLYWAWSSSLATIHTASVVLPKKHELLYSNYIQPGEVASKLEKLTLSFNQELPKEETFRIGVMFSKTGVTLLNRAESAFRLNQWSEAKKAYNEAVLFYDQFSELYKKNKTEFILDLKAKVRECDAKLEEERMERNKEIAEEKYAEGLSAFNDEDYETAKQLFTQAQNMYKSTGNSDKSEECQGYIDRCTSFMEDTALRSEADALFNEGVSYMEQSNYEGAKAAFEQALVKYEEVGDELKAEECRQKIALCENAVKGEGGEQDGGSCAGTILLFCMVTGGLGISLKREK